MNAPRDPDLDVASSPATPPQLLADIARRRWDLHNVISANTRAYPELITWMSQINPRFRRESQPARPTPAAPANRAPVYQVPYTSARPSSARRSGIGWWLGGCGCLVVAMFLAGAIFGGLGAALAPGTPSSGQPSAASRPSNSELEAQKALFKQELARINELAAQLDGNPAAPLVADFPSFRREEARLADPNLTILSARSLVSFATRFREGLETRAAAAAIRRVNATGSLTEGLIDAAGNGYIDVQWDAATVCGAAEKQGWSTSGCVKDFSTVHLLPENEYGNEWSMRMTVVHELAHMYQLADSARVPDGHGDYKDLLAQGLFQGDKEVMADCYALTYYNQWTLENGGTEMGYGYVCNETERQAIREWAADVKAPVSG
ncbi:hypothetical protein [Paenarthrobacter sp. JL.01a]|uniref:variant leucine-rich repeat-containing protein n=1 Tax=Paenarthrobacter sp. JL.01a TaxID=2979324 RepID=UPI0021C92473|nr:hypothetical protein [Paenarthrobacter sp. JL.01a]UXM92140.1 hypothetical protein N5P29_02120 [Paenarthrobacter sp. JL.01a]